MICCTAWRAKRYAGGGPLERRVCAQHGRDLWGESPLWRYRLGLIVSKDNHEPKARARPRGIVRRKPACKSCEATDRNRIVKAEGCEASWHMAAKPTGMQPTLNAALVTETVRVLTWGDLRRKRSGAIQTDVKQSDQP